MPSILPYPFWLLSPEYTSGTFDEQNKSDFKQKYALECSGYRAYGEDEGKPLIYVAKTFSVTADYEHSKEKSDSLSLYTDNQLLNSLLDISKHNSFLFVMPQGQYSRPRWLHRMNNFILTSCWKSLCKCLIRRQ